MKTTTIKTVTDVDYVLYFDKDKQLVGYELSQDDKDAFQLRYHTPDNCGIEATIPDNTVYYLEIFGVSSTLAFLTKEDEGTGELLFYRPSPVEMAREISKNTGSLVALHSNTETKNVPVVLQDARVRDILSRVPYPNWMEECWATPVWIEIWRAKPYLQNARLEFSSAKYKEKSTKTTPADCAYHRVARGIATCIINHSALCKFPSCTEFELP
jgi:hypothetical protein